MNIYLELIFRNYSLQSGGSFKNQRGQTIDYDSKYLITGDIINEDGKAVPVTLKTRPSDKDKLEKFLKDLAPYEKISCECSLNLYNKNISLTILNAKKV